MLRLGLLMIALLLTGTGTVLLVLPGSHPWWPFLIWGPVLVLAILCERWRYRRKERDDGRQQWQQTGERFEDPETGEIMEVHYDPVSGERRYVKKEDGG